MPDPQIAIEAAKTAVNNGITSEQAIGNLKVQSSQITTEFLGWIKAAAPDAARFVAEQTTLFVREFLAWHFYNCIVRAAMWAVVVVVICYFTNRLYKLAKTYKPDGSMDTPESLVRVSSLFPLIFVFLIFWHGIMNNVSAAIKIKTAPRVYLADYIAKTITGHKIGDNSN